MRDALRGAQTLKTLWVPQHLATLLAQRDDLACHLLWSGHADLKDLLGFLASGKTAASREAQGDASRILGLPHTVWLGDPKSDAMASELIGKPTCSRPRVLAVSSSKAREA